MRASVLAIVLIVVACGSSSTPTVQYSPSATVTQSPTALEGDLPVWTEIYDPSSGQIDIAGGFLRFPGGVFQRDPLAKMVQDSTRPGLVGTPDKPYLYSHGSMVTVQITYDRTVGRWLPVNRAQVSDDGLRYAYVDYDVGAATSHGIHIVDVRLGSDLVVYRDPNQPQYNVVGLVQENIYLTDCVFTHTAGNCWGPLRRLDTTTGTITKVSDRRGTWVISGRIGWVVTCWPTQTAPQCFGSYDERGPNQLVRIDLATGNEETWDSGSGIEFLVGIDGDRAPIIVVGDAGECAVLKVSAPQHTEPLFSLPANHIWGCFNNFNSAAVDRFGIWLQYVPPGTTRAGIYLYSKASGVRKVSDFQGLPAGSFA